MRVAQSECSMFLMYRDLAESHPFLDVRIGEAARWAFAAPQDHAETLSDTLSAQTPFTEVGGLGLEFRVRDSLPS